MTALQDLAPQLPDRAVSPHGLRTVQSGACNRVAEKAMQPPGVSILGRLLSTENHVAL